MDAVTKLEQKLEADPASKVFLPLAEQYRKAGQMEQAESILRSGIEHNPTYAAAQVALGRVLLERGSKEEGRRLLTILLRMVPDNLLAQRLLDEAGGPLDNVAGLEQSEPEPVPPAAPELQPQIETSPFESSPVAETEPHLETTPHMVISPEPMAASPEAMATAPEPMTASPEPMATAPEPMTASPEPMATAPEPMTASPEPITTTPEPVASPPAVEPQPALESEATWQAATAAQESPDVTPAPGVWKTDDLLTEHDETAERSDGRFDTLRLSREEVEAQVEEMRNRSGSSDMSWADSLSSEEPPAMGAAPVPEVAPESFQTESSVPQEFLTPEGQPMPGHAAPELLRTEDLVPPLLKVEPLPEDSLAGATDFEKLRDTIQGGDRTEAFHPVAQATDTPMQTYSPPDDLPSQILPEEADRILTLARMYRRQGELDRSAGVYRDLLESAPDNQVARRELEEVCGENLPEITGEDIIPAGVPLSAAPRAATEKLEDARQRKIVFLKTWLDQIRVEG